jgi:hypothetical protein
MIEALTKISMILKRLDGAFFIYKKIIGGKK